MRFRVHPPHDLEGYGLYRISNSKRPPARINRILKVLRCRMAGMAIAEVPWQAYQFQNKEFDELQKWLKRDEELWGYVEDKVRYDYDSGRECLVSRRPTVLHVCFISFVSQEITQNLHAIAESNDPVASAFARKVRSISSARFDLLGTEEIEGEPKMRRNPDFSFKHLEAAWPGVILELSYPSKRKNLPFLADDYILETEGQVRVLVGLYLDSQTKKASISTWQPLFRANEHGVITELEAALVQSDELFRDRHGNPNQDPKSGLHLDLKDFGPKHLTTDLTSDIPISISSATLCALLARAEAEHQNDIDRRNGIPHRPKGIIIRKRRRAEMESDSEASWDEITRLDKVAATETATKEENIGPDTKDGASNDDQTKVYDASIRKVPHLGNKTSSEKQLSEDELMKDAS